MMYLDHICAYIHAIKGSKCVAMSRLSCVFHVMMPCLIGVFLKELTLLIFCN